MGSVVLLKFETDKPGLYYVARVKILEKDWHELSVEDLIMEVDRLQSSGKSPETILKEIDGFDFKVLDCSYEYEYHVRR